MMLLAAKERTHLEQIDQALQRRAFEILPAGAWKPVPALC